MGARARLLALIIVVLVALTAACGVQDNPTLTEASRQEPSSSVVVRDDLQSIFNGAGVRGTFVLLDVARGQTTVVDRARAERQAVPASTFKIAHSIIALETGVVRDENEVVPYGGRPQPPGPTTSLTWFGQRL